MDGEQLNFPIVKRAVRELSEKIAQALQRTGELDVERRRAAMADRLKDPELDRQFESASRQVESQQETVYPIPKKVILWVDDRPNNNIYEREALKRYGVEFELATSTDEAVKILATRKFDAIISDMGRPPDGLAGYTLLRAVRGKGDNTPYFIYAGSRAPQHVSEARRQGAQGSTNLAAELIDLVLSAIGVPSS